MPERERVLQERDFFSGRRLHHLLYIGCYKPPHAALSGTAFSPSLKFSSFGDPLCKQCATQQTTLHDYGHAPFSNSNGESTGGNAGGGLTSYLLELGKTPSKTHGDTATPARLDLGWVPIYRVPNGEDSPVTIGSTAEKPYSITFRPHHDVPLPVQRRTNGPERNYPY